ncbi:MAG: hypothetical protein A3D24_01135 [Candidatus Blackburnbacteria bacterium RIFCSPHIGHO2_02_FULL_39_13]|uniref:RDD domain-containing protein n=1 Tax=Candidatus Blackburnbacteria bacterium RIFCSPLOWO2_01_FULL_40_20 TaxID=1797519 RepID=A0A1G1VFC4_9BACT|nr:MAG: RDD domain protein [Microgenomates group bacterium GW2011_GWA2_39_19]OGY07304.1 MAG: hypothetical protein A2694_04315 [Candidatus Blackburnbacteria bacterium RIFCSPHIGHO2_01_FULL_40_17]OGY08064.1 MAG: hypothetical protein A3D24_01135 [Candidatus Blackburnbacteria bacterium RIFCSPHIGHO2_02_FULL_39_13]OGY14153.1 MAG: hypothetical protein A3A77_04815 [Candidatus Blackburnbacteria bacterium RIFCSPLOWO2_01_FULL_40_20]OGY15449.1 MAG: hypothetical protein A3I52_01940 [Candidatus Blackburnbacte
MNAQFVGFGRRFIAALIDGIIITVFSFLVGIVLGLAGANAQGALSYAVGLLLGIGYYVFYQSSAGQTLGKKVLGIKVVDAQGNKPTAITFFLREIIGKAVSGIILGIGYLMVLWDGKKQALHDKIASTYVVRV